MKNVVALFSFIVLIIAMIHYYFIPRIAVYNTIDQLEISLSKVKTMVASSETIYFFSNNPSNEAEIRFKTQFLLVPRIVVSAKIEEIPADSYIVFVDDKTVSAIESETGKIARQSTFLFSTNNEFIVSLLKKKQ